MHQRKAEYIDARPFTASSTKSSCYARPDHTCWSWLCKNSMAEALTLGDEPAALRRL
jgi:hypothetical protein